MLSPQLRQTAWTIANIIGSAVFLYFASMTWLEPNLRGEEVARGGDGVIWMLSAFPVLLVFFLSNVIWVGLVVRQWIRTGKVSSDPNLLIVGAIWVSALAVVDRLRF